METGGERPSYDILGSRKDLAQFKAGAPPLDPPLLLTYLSIALGESVALVQLSEGGVGQTVSFQQSFKHHHNLFTDFLLKKDSIVCTLSYIVFY